MGRDQAQLGKEDAVSEASRPTSTRSLPVESDAASAGDVIVNVDDSTHLPQAVRPNDLWRVDVKGEFKHGDGRRCYALTVSDQASRFIPGLRSACIDEGDTGHRGFRAAVADVSDRYIRRIRRHSTRAFKPTTSNGARLAGRDASPTQVRTT